MYQFLVQFIVQSVLFDLSLFIIYFSNDNRQMDTLLSNRFDRTKWVKMNVRASEPSRRQ